MINAVLLFSLTHLAAGPPFGALQQHKAGGYTAAWAFSSELPHLAPAMPCHAGLTWCCTAPVTQA